MSDTTFDLMVLYNGVTYEEPVFMGSISYRNIQGFPCEDVDLVAEGDDYFLPPVPGLYRISYEATSVEDYWDAWEYCDVTY